MRLAVLGAGPVGLEMAVAAVRQENYAWIIFDVDALIQLCTSSQIMYGFTDEGYQYVCSREELILPPMSIPGAMSLFSAQTP